MKRFQIKVGRWSLVLILTPLILELARREGDEFEVVWTRG